MSIKNVVVVGLGPSGVATATALAKALPSTHRVVAISRDAFGFWPIASLRAAVVPGWEDKTTLALTAGIFPKDSRHVVLAGTKVLHLDRDLHSLTVDIAHPELGREIPFDFLVLATGSTSSWPARPIEGETQIKDVVESYKRLQREVGAAKSVLVVGGGATGIEYAGEVKAQYPNKDVTLVTSASALFDGPGFSPKFGKNLQSQLESLGVHVKFDTKLDVAALASGPIPSQTFTFADRSSVNADYLMLATGAKPNSEVLSTLDGDLVTSSGAIKVLPTLQLPSAPHIFAVGDVTDRPESKQAATGGNHVPIVTANIISLIKGSKALKEHKVGGPLILVTVGPQGGAAQLFGWVVGAWMAKRAKSGSLLLNLFTAAYPAVKA